MKEKQLGLLGKKIGMTQVYDKANRLVPVTVIELTPSCVTQIKTKEKEGYNAVQVGYREQKESRLSKGELGHLKKANVPAYAELMEFQVEDTSAYKLGDKLTVASFAEGQLVDVVGATKGRGFQGVVKRHNFSGGPASHGSMFHRRGGSFGCRQWPGHVIKNRPMPGHMGTNQVTVQNLPVVKVLEDKHIILVEGSIPGNKGSLVMVRNAKKAKVTA
ncbi:MAG: 50S ribosomal protein L3 [Verrucomicrobia bacterium GWF2_51_19]|nr:MAG: 50S ribosomal protein L3 [Verrucomicrobia bacterium GWF2_51_19]HCJ12571.1 50S ribosomal protein L3 [Opitutae bacterium]